MTFIDISKIEAGKIKIENIDFSFRELMQSMKEIMSLKAEQRGLAFQVNISDGPARTDLLAIRPG